jgi:hypothetical protein
MARRFGVFLHLHKKSGESVAFAPGDEIPVWANGKFGDHVPTYSDKEPAPDDALEQAKAAATAAGVSDEGTVDEINARIAAAKAAAGGAPSDDDLRKQLEAIGQPTDGTHDELVKRLADHGE